MMASDEAWIKIGVDARSLSRTLTGIGRYTLELCRALLDTKTCTLILYSPQPLPETILSLLPGAIVRHKQWQSPLLIQCWAQTYLPLWAKQDNVDVFWGPGHRLPQLLSKSIARVVTIHDLVWKLAAETMKPVSRFLERYQMPAAIHLSDYVVAVSHATASAVQDAFDLDPARLHYVPNAVRSSDHLVSPQLLNDLTINQAYFLFVGTLEPRKNLARLLQAYAALPLDIKQQAKFVIAGGKGWGDVNLRQQIQQQNLQEHVVLLGYVNDATLATLYANCLFLAMPSLYEGFGLPLLEAMHYAKPVLTANISSMPEVVEDAGLLVDPLSVESITQALLSLITDDDLRNTLSIKAKQRASCFDWQSSAEKLMEAFRLAIKKRQHLS